MTKEDLRLGDIVLINKDEDVITLGLVTEMDDNGIKSINGSYVPYSSLQPVHLRDQMTIFSALGWRNIPGLIIDKFKKDDYTIEMVNKANEDGMVHLIIYSDKVESEDDGIHGWFDELHMVQHEFQDKFGVEFPIKI